MRKLFAGKAKTFARDEKGATMVEYGLLVAVIALAVVGAATTFGTSLSTMFTHAGTIVTGTPNTH